MESEVAAPQMRFDQAVLRGKHAVAIAAMEDRGTPIDVPLLQDLRTYWDGIKARLIAEVDTGLACMKGPPSRPRNLLLWPNSEAGTGRFCPPEPRR